MTTQLIKSDVQKQLQKQFKTPITSTKYMAFQKENREFPSYLRLINLYGDWDSLTQSIWGVGTKIRQWTEHEAIEVVKKHVPTTVSSTAYQALRREGKSFLPTFSVLKQLFGSWQAASVAIWEEEKVPPKTWDSLEELKPLILTYFPKSIPSNEYIQTRKQQQLPIPAIDVLYHRVGKWSEVKKWLWNEETKNWTKEAIIPIVLNTTPHRVGRATYESLSTRNDELPSISTINKYFGSWAVLMDELYPLTAEPSKESMVALMKQYFTQEPLQKHYEAVRREVPGLPSLFKLEAQFGNWQSLMAICYHNKPLDYHQKVLKRSRYTDIQVIQAIRHQFKAPPTVNDYRQQVLQKRWLPSKNTVIAKFGSWENAMIECFPEQTASRPIYSWDKLLIKQRVTQAVLDLGESLNTTLYHEWRLTQVTQTPNLGTISRHFGSFSRLLIELGVVQEGKHKTTIKRAKDAKQLAYWMERYLDELEGSPTVRTYQVFKDKYPKAPSLETLRRQYGPYWKDVVFAFTEGWDLRSYQVYPDHVLKQALKTAHKTIGSPLTRGRYEEFRKASEEPMPSSTCISLRFQSWTKALEQVQISHRHYTTFEHRALQQIVDAKQQEGIQSLDDFLGWVLEI